MHGCAFRPRRAAVLLPLAIIPSGYWEAMQIEPTVPGFLPMNVALVILQCLHVFWFWLVLKAVRKFVVAGGADDVRENSDSDED